MSNPGPELPPYNLATSSFEAASAPIDLNGSRLFYLPLPARIDRLQVLVDSYLNRYEDTSLRIPASNDWFGVAAPYVVLTLADYGSLAREAASQGWYAYDEILFGVPLAWYRRASPGQPFTFKGWANFAPMIYVSQPAAQWLGREVLGFVKTKGTVETRPDAWRNTGDGPYEMLTVYTQGFNEAFTGETASAQCLLQITSDTPSLVGRYPPDYETMLNPFAAAPSVITHGWQLMSDMFRSIYGNPVVGKPPGVPNPLDPMSWVRMMNPTTWPDTWDPVRLQNTAQLGWAVWSGLQWGRTVNLINLKQFPEADDPADIYDSRSACYSAVVNTPMTFSDIFEGGMLGAANIARGQLSGGYRVQLTSDDSQPIVSMLGLEPVESWRAHDGRRIDVVEPMIPTWVHGDLRLNQAENYRVKTPRGPESPPIIYLNTLAQARPGGIPPFRACDSSFRVLPLRADPNILRRFLGRYLDQVELPEGVSFQLRGSYVYLVITDYTDMISIPRPEGFMDIRELAFQVPVTYVDGDHTYRGWVSPFIFADNDAWAITMRETYGFEIRLGDIESPPNHWLAPPVRPGQPRCLLRLHSDVLPALSVGAQLQSELVAEVVEGLQPPASAERVAHRAAPDGDQPLPWRGIYKPSGPDDRSRRHGFALKQFRDAERPHRACYQAIVQTPIECRVDEQTERRAPEYAPDLYLKLWHYADLPIAHYLGLMPAWEEIDDGRTVHVYRVHEPRAFDAEAEFKSGRTLYFRTAVTGRNRGWQRGRQWSPKNR